MYLKVQYNNSIKPYTLTNNYNKPYIKVNGSILPLTTNTTNGIHINIQANNTTYRPLEYNSMSTSNTYYTSAINSNGLSSTTALTRSSTSQTIYHTCSSTSGTSYLTRSSTSGTSYLTQSVSKNREATYQRQFSYSYTEWSGGRVITYASYASTDLVTISAFSASGPYTYYVGYSTNTFSYINLGLYASQSITMSRSSNNQTLNPSVISNGAAGYYLNFIYLQKYTTRTYGKPFMAKLESTASMLPANIGANYTKNGDQYTATVTYYNTTGGGAGTIVYQSHSLLTIADLRTSIASTTGTSYLTCSSTSATSYLTRSSTSRTEYKTRESTSGYSGISSSSSQSSGWL